MRNKVTTFKEFEKKNELSDGITALTKLEDGEYEKIEEPIKIIKVMGIITDENEILKIEEAFQIDTSLTIKNIKRGDIIWLTALLEKPNSVTSWNAQTLGVVKCRIVDYFYGLNKLKNK